MNFRKKFLIIFTFLITLPNFVFADDNIPSFFGFDTSSPQAWINSIYRYGISLGALLALAGLIYGGFRYLTSAGNEEAVKSGKEAIFAALTGLVIMLFSHMILTTIDPRLVELRLTIPEVDLPGATGSQQCESDGDCPSGQTCVVYTDGHGVCEAPSSSTACDNDDDCSGSSVCLHPGEPNSVCSDSAIGQANHCCRSGSNPCDSGLDCIQNVQHFMGVTCDNGVCSNGEAGNACLNDTHCDEGFECQERDNSCIASESGRDFRDECERNEQCSTSFCAQTIGLCTSGDNTSTDGQGAPQCEADNDCISSYYCPIERRFGKYCTSQKGFDESCTRDMECQSGYCDRDNECG